MKVIKSVQVTWNWTGDSDLIKGFQVAITPSSENPNTKIISIAKIGAGFTSYTFDQLILDDTVTYSAWVQALYAGVDSSWVSTGNISVSDDGNATIATTVAVDAAALEAENNAKAYADSLKTLIDSDILDLQNQVDGVAGAWFYAYIPTLANEPAVNWTTDEEKSIHVDDVFYNTATGYAYHFIYNGTYSWERIVDQDVVTALANASTAQDTADSKMRIFGIQPVPPYDTGDLWSGGPTGDLKKCIIAKTSGQSFSESDWELASKYTEGAPAGTYVGTILAETVESVDGAQAKADTAETTAISTSNSYTDTQVAAAQTAAETYAAAQASAAETTAKAYADGIVTVAEQSAIDTAEAYTDAANIALQTTLEAYADGVADAAELAAINSANAYADARKIEAESYADGIVTTAEQNAIDSANAYTDAAKTAAETTAAAYADGVADAAELAAIASAEAYADARKAEALAYADVKKTEAEAYADGVADAAETAAITSAQAYADLKKTEANAYADGIVSDEEARAIADAQAKADAAKDAAIASSSKSSWKYVGSWNIAVDGQGFNFSFSPVPEQYVEFMRLALEQKDLEGSVRITLNGTDLGFVNAADNVRQWKYFDLPNESINTVKDNIIRIEHVTGLPADWGYIYTVQMYFDQSAAALAGVTWENIDGRPSNLADLDLTASTKLSGISEGADVTDYAYIESDAQSKANVALSAAQDYADAQVAATETTLQAYADGVASSAETAAITSANAYADLKKTEAKAYADGIVSDEEARAIADAQTKANAAQAAAEATSQAYTESWSEQGADVTANNILVTNPNFENGLKYWSTSYTGETVPDNVTGNIVAAGEWGGKVAEITGAAWLYYGKPIPVNTSKVYKGRFRVRQTVDPTEGQARVYAGLATLDSSYNNLTGGAGTHRYFIVSSVSITTAGGWQQFEGRITGTGDLSTNFREGTAYVRPMCIVNYSGGNGTAQIDGLEFYEDIPATNGIEDGADVTDYASIEADAQARADAALSSAQSYADAQAVAAQVAAEAYADGVADASELAAIAAAEAYADARKVEALAYADGVATDAENAAITSAEAYADLKKTEANAYADGIVSDEEARAIADAQAKADAAQAAAQTYTEGWSAEGAQVNAPSLGIKVNYTSFTSASPGEIFFHGFDSDGSPADIDGYLYFNGVKVTMLRSFTNTNAAGEGYIVFDTSGITFDNGVRYGIINKVDGIWKTLGNMTVTVNDTTYAIGTARMSTSEMVDSATVWTSPISIRVLPDFNATVGAPAGTYVGTNLAEDVESVTGSQDKADAAELAAIAAAEAYADARKIEAQAYADGIVTAEEARAIADAQAKADAAQAAAQLYTEGWSESGATVGATWGTNITSQPTDSELLNSQQQYDAIQGTKPPADADKTVTAFETGFTGNSGGITMGSTAVIKSSNFVQGSSGWIIRGDGTAEFAATNIRGQLTASQISVTSLSALSADLGTVTAGAISGATVTGSTIQTNTSVTTTGGIKIVGDTLYVYDDSGNLRVKLGDLS